MSLIKSKPDNRVKKSFIFLADNDSIDIMVHPKTLEWTQLPLPSVVKGDEGIGGLLELEELDDVRVVREQGTGGSMLSFEPITKKKSSTKKKRSLADLYGVSLDDFIHVDDFVEPADLEKEDRKNTIDRLPAQVKDPKKKLAKDSKATKKIPSPIESPPPMDEAPLVDQVSTKEWESFQLHALILQGLQAQGFASPTPIQAQALPMALGSSKRDIIGAAETGSGKTLAYSLPILQYLASSTVSHENATSPPLTALILAPTRELAIQVTDHLKKTAQFMRVKIAPIVGGMSIQKQRRVVQQTLHILVATPGRLWELMGEDSGLVARLRQIRFLVIDEADRMLEGGHFRELSSILEQISLKRDDTFKERQSFLFSATLLHTQGIHQKLDKKLKRAGMTVQDMIDKIEFRDPNPEYVNVSSATIMARSITETRVECLATEKDAILYYILLRHPGRTIVFVNSIDSIRRIVPLFSLLRVAVYPLHADMQQRQRLKNLERFKSNSDAVLIATDVAARGLDIPNIDHVIHYQLPRSADLYVHRSGRTARAKKEGISVMLCSPDQIPVYKKICFSLGKEDGVPVFPIDRSIMSSINKRIAAARKVDEAEHRLKKKQSEKDWFAKAAAEADIDLDDDVVSDNEVSRNDKENQTKIKQLKDALNGLLTQKLIPKGMSMKYLTSNTVADLPQILMASQTSGASLPAQKPQSALLAMVKK